MRFGLSYENYLVAPGAIWDLPPGEFPLDVDTADRMLDPRLAIAAAGDGAGAGMNFIRRFGGERLVSLVSVLAHTMESGPTVAVRLLDSEDGVVWESTSFPWAPPSGDFLRHLHWLLDTPVAAHALQVMLLGPWIDNNMSVGGLWAGPMWYPPEGLEEGWTTRVVDPGTLSRSAGGQGYPRRRQRYRTFQGRLIDLDREWAYGADGSEVMDLQRLLYQVGTTDPVIVFPRTVDSSSTVDVHALHRLGVYGRFSSIGAIKDTGADRYVWEGFEVEELL